LKDIVQKFMNSAAALCNERFAQLCACPEGGSELQLFEESWQQEAGLCNQLRDNISRQDHKKVGAIRVSDEDRQEAGISALPEPELASVGDGTDSIPSLWQLHPIWMDEEVFLAQLFRRARLVDEAFQQRMASVVRCNCEDTIPIEFFSAPIKSVARMREKLAKYVPPHPAAIWPLTANILDPVRASIVCDGPKQILQAANWFISNECISDTHKYPLTVVRVKNKFSPSHPEVTDGYRDLKLFISFMDSRGLGIIGEIQFHDRILYGLKMQMHKLYKIKRAQSADNIT